LIAALSLSGLPTNEFTFIGFLPSRKVQRQNVLKDLSLEPRTLVFYEAPHRIIETLSDMEKVFLERRVSVIKEITKIHEEVLRGSIPDVLSKLRNSTIAGEYIIVLEGRTAEKKPITREALLEISYLMKRGLGRKEAVKKIAEEYGLNKKELYDKSLSDK
jgi:16S rRNA (cytidine1402-2'-O)-methyltransferase